MAKARRAKKSKMPKKILLMLIAFLLIGLIYFITMVKNETSIFSTLKSEIDTYDANDFVKDVFTDGNTKYLPIIYDEPYEHEKLTRQIIEEKIKAMGLSIQSISSEIIGTGTQIKTNGATFTVIIYGDIDGNGKVNTRDVQCIVKHLCYGGNSTLTGIKRRAANVYETDKDEITVRDAQKIIKFIIGTEKIVDKIPTSDIKEDREKPVITLNGAPEMTIKVGDKYNEEGAKVTDNLSYLDPNIQDRLVITGSVDINKIDDYILTYSVKDLNGNEADKKQRIVHVVNYVEDINIGVDLNTQYTDGEEIKLPENFVAYPKMKVGGWLTTPIDNSKITITPEIAKLNPNETESQMTVTILYKEEYAKDKYVEVKKEYTITVTEAKPIITLNTYDGAENVKLKVIDEEYEENLKTDVIALDKHNGNTLEVTRKITNEAGEEVDEIDTSKPGIFTIVYTTEPDSIGKIGTKTRIVEVVDYIEYITFSTDKGEDDSKFKSLYIDGETISLEGIKGITTYKYDKTRKEEISSEDLSTDITTVTYDRTPNGVNKNREIVVSYIDPIFKTVYKSGEHGDKITIDVMKKVETLEIVTGVSLPTGYNVTRDKYEKIFVARLESGEDEIDVTIDDVEIKVTKAGETEAVIERDDCLEPCRTRAWAIPAENAIDIYFIGVNAGSYTINVKPKETTNTKALTVKTTSNDTVNCAKISDFTRDFEGTKKVGTNSSTGYRAGEVIYADISFCHKYAKGDSENYHYSEKHSVKAGNLEAPTVWKINYDGLGTETGMTQMSDTEIKAEYLNSNGTVSNKNTNSNSEVVKIRLTSQKDIVNVETDICVSIAFEHDISKKVIRMYPTAHDTLHLGTKGDTGNNAEIALSLRALRTGEDYGYTIKEINNIYYTIIPIYVYDDYGIDKVVYASDIGTKITATDINGSTSLPNTKSCIKLIGIGEDGNEAKVVGTNDPVVTSIGLAIKNPEANMYGEDYLEDGFIQIKFEETIAKVYNPINIIKRAVEYIEYQGIKIEEEYCFEELNVASVKAGERQEDISNIIGTVEEEIVNENGPSTWRQVNAQNIMLNIEVEDGIANISFGAKNEGNYKINLTVNGESMIPRNSNGREEPIIVNVKEDTEITKIAIYEYDENGDEIYHYDGNGNLVVPEIPSYGDANINAKEIKAIKFYHEYTKGEGAAKKVVAVREVKDVPHSSVKIKTQPSNTSGKVLGTALRLTGHPDSGFSEIESSGDLLNPKVNAIQVVVNKTPETINMIGTGKLFFTLEIPNRDGIDIPYNVSIDVQRELEVTGVTIGWDDESDSSNPEKLNIYTKSSSINEDATPNPDKVIPNSKIYIKEQDGEIYTLVPINLVSGTKTIYSDDLKASSINVSIDGTTPMGQITFIDNINLGNATSTNKYKNLLVLGFTKVGNSFIKAEKDSRIEYVGIAVPKSRQSLLNEETPNALVAPVWVQLKNIEVKFSVDGVTSKDMHYFEINAEDYIEQQYASIEAKLKNEPTEIAVGSPIDNVKNLITLRYCKGKQIEVITEDDVNFEVLHADEDFEEDKINTIQTGENNIIIKYTRNSDEFIEMITVIGK